MSLLPWNDFVASQIHHLENSVSRQIFQMPTRFITQYQSIYSVISPPCSAQKFEWKEKLSHSWWWIRVFQDSPFLLKACVLSWAVNQLLSLKQQAHFTDLTENICQIPNLKTNCFCLPVSLSSKMGVCERSGCSAHNSITHVLFLR